MTVIAAYLYRNGARVRPVSIDERIDCAHDKSEFVWIGVADPTDAEMAALQRSYDLHPLAIEDAINANQLPKVDIYGDQWSRPSRWCNFGCGRGPSSGGFGGDV